MYHVLNRGNGCADVFHKEDDFSAFVRLMREAHEKVPMRLVGYCLLTNHFHLVLWPHGDGDLSRWMQWLLTAHVRRYHRHDKATEENCRRLEKADVRWMLLPSLTREVHLLKDIH